MAEYTAINPATQQRLKWDGKAWKPVGATGVMSDVKPDQEALLAARKTAETADFQSRQAQRFLELNRETGTGGLRNFGVGIGSWGASVGDLVGMVDPKWDAMKGITASTAPQGRVEGSGATSDYEARQMTAAFPSVEKRGDTNTLIAKRIAADQARARARASFLDTWMAQNGTLLGADRAFGSWWTKYSREKGIGADAAPKPAAGPVKKTAPDPLGIRGR